MNERRHDGSSIDLERALVRYVAERRISRRELLDRIGRLGAAAALGPVVAACTAAASPTPSPSAPATTPPATPTGGPSPTPGPTPEPTPVPTPEGELFVYNWADYMGESVVPGFEERYGVKVTYDFFDNYDTMMAKVGPGGSGYDVTFPASVDVHGLVERGLIGPLDLSLIPNRVNLGAEWQDPGYDPGNAHSMPYMWWTTGVAYDTERIGEELTSWAALWDPRWKDHISMLDDYREVFAAALLRLGKSVNTTDEAELDAALALLKEQKPLVRTYTTDDIGVLSSGDAWVAHSWGADAYQVAPERPSVKYFLPEEGGVRGSDTLVILTGAQHPVAAHLFIDYVLDPQVSADNTNYIGYMGPNAAAREFIDPAILEDPSLNPDQAIIGKLQELLDLGADLEKYASRWSELRAGA